MQTNQKKIKFSKLILNSNRTKKTVSTKQKGSRYFSPTPSQIENESTIENKSSDRLHLVKKLNETSDESDFENPKSKKFVQSAFQVLLKNSNKNCNKKKENVTKDSSDTNREHLQLAIALSKSSYVLENSGSSNSEDQSANFTFPSTQEKIASVKQTLEKFGFKSNKICSSSSNRIQLRTGKKKYKYITPILYIRSEIDRQKLIEEKVAQIFSNIRDKPTNINTHPTDLKPLSFLLRDCYDPNSTIFRKYSLSTSEMNDINTFYNGTVEISNTKIGSLLKDWNTIRGREKTPEKNIYIENIETDHNFDSMTKNVSSPTNKKVEDDNDNDLFYETVPRFNQFENESILEDSLDRNVTPDLFSDVSFDTQHKKYAVSVNNLEDSNSACIDLTQSSKESEENTAECVYNNEKLDSIQSKTEINSKSGVDMSSITSLINTIDKICTKHKQNEETSDTNTPDSLHNSKNSNDIAETIDLTSDNCDVKDQTVSENCNSRTSMNKENDINDSSDHFHKTFISDSENDDNEHLFLSQSSMNNSIEISDEELNYSSVISNKFIDFNGDIENFVSKHTSEEIQSDDEISPQKNWDSQQNCHSCPEIENVLQRSPKKSYSCDDDRGQFSLESSPIKSFRSVPATNEVLNLSDSTNEALKQNSLWDKLDMSVKVTPKRNNSIVREPEKVTTPNIFDNDELIIKTKNITPMANFDDMDTPQRNVELDKFGLKPLKRAKGVKILKYIYNATHPVTRVEEKCNNSSSDEENNRVIKKIKILTKKTENAKSPERIAQYRNDDAQFLVELTKNVPVEEMIFERKQSTRISSCRIPFHVVWNNYLSYNPEVHRKMLLYEPLQVEEIYMNLRNMGYKFHVEDLITFFDKKCITIRTAQNNHRNNKRSSQKH